ncbi:MAG: DUF748 domain-containing protein, partial [Desulfobacteraceae bacterium]|nr:DUF748 domain-containing protein [Desulfobacteraceae bacterium]
MTAKHSPYFGRWLILYILAGILFIYGAAGFIAIPIVAEKKLPEIASSVIDGQITVKDIDFNPFSLSASVEGLSVARGSGNPALEIERISANLQISSIFRQGAVIKSVEINGPSFDLAKSENGELNILDLLKEKKKAPSETAPDKKIGKSGSPVYFSIEKIRINRGRLSYRDDQSGFETRVGGISLMVKNLASKSPEEAEFSFSAETKAGEKIDCSGKIGLFPLSADARINVKDADIPKYAPFYRDLTGLSIRSGKVSVSANIDYPQSSSSESAPMISNGQVKISSLSAVDPQTGNAALEISGFSVSGIQVDPKNRSITADFVSSREGKILCERTRKGGINFSRIVARSPAEDENSSKKPGKRASSSWKVGLKTLNLLAYTVQYSDHVPENPVSMKIRHLNIRMYDFTLQKDSPNHWSIYSLTEQGVITAQGRIQLIPLMAELDFKMTDFGLDTADPYAAPFGMNIEKGTLNVDGSIEAKATQHGFSGSYTGDLWIDDLAVSDIKAGPLEINIKDGSLKLASRIEGQTTPDGFSGSYTGDFTIDDLGLNGIRSDSLGIDVTKGRLNLGGKIEARSSPDGFSGNYAGNLGIDDLSATGIKAGPLEINIKDGSLKLASRIEGQTTPDGFSGNYTGDFNIDKLWLSGIKSDSLGIDVTKGRLDLGGKIEAKASPDGFSGSYAGSLGINDLAV